MTVVVEVEWGSPGGHVAARDAFGGVVELPMGDLTYRGNLADLVDYHQVALDALAEYAQQGADE